VGEKPTVLSKLNTLLKPTLPSLEAYSSRTSLIPKRALNLSQIFGRIPLPIILVTRWPCSCSEGGASIRYRHNSPTYPIADASNCLTSFQSQAGGNLRR